MLSDVGCAERRGHVSNPIIRGAVSEQHWRANVKPASDLKKYLSTLWAGTEQTGLNLIKFNKIQFYLYSAGTEQTGLNLIK